ncbi:MAG TPA: hypothetical protein VFG07_08840 [Thermoplasmata archaeon]|nr:hypothetical protein [Thermoplasmata archaeon]
MSAAFPVPTVGFPRANYRPPSASTAESLVLVALVFQVIGAAILVIGLGFVIGFAVFAPFAYSWLAVSVVSLVVLVTGLFLYLAYTLSYLPIKAGDYVGAQAPTLVFGILSLFFGLLPGILYIIGYVKLGDAIREQQMAAGWYSPVPPPPAPR